MRFVLTLFVHEQSVEQKLVYAILESSSHLYTLGQKRRKTYLYQSLTDHSIWSDPSSWRECINSIVKSKVEDAVQRRKKVQEAEQENTKLSLKLFSKVAGSKFKGILQSKEEKYKEDMKEQSSLIFHELSRFVGFMNNIGLPYSFSN